MATKKDENGASSKSKGKKLKEVVVPPACAILGVVGGSLLGQLIDKVVKANDTTDINWRKFCRPVVQITAGVAGAYLLKPQYLKFIAVGVAGSGVISTVKVLLKKDILNGLGSFNITDPVKRVFREPINLSIAPYDPELPALPANTETVQVEMAPDVMGELDDYQEIQEVQIL